VGRTLPEKTEKKKKTLTYNPKHPRRECVLGRTVQLFSPLPSVWIRSRGASCRYAKIVRGGEEERKPKNRRRGIRASIRVILKGHTLYSSTMPGIFKLHI